MNETAMRRVEYQKGKSRLSGSVGREFASNKYVYLMALPVIAYYILFCYKPMYGVIIAFKDYSPMLGFTRSPWAGFKHFAEYVGGVYFGRTVRNTLLINLYSLIWSFPAPIVLALLINELKNYRFKRTVQTLSYLPHFVSLVVAVGIVKDFTATDALINDIAVALGGERGDLLIRPELFRTIYIGSGIWQEIGWGSIIYLAALSSVDVEQYESAVIDGANRWKQMIHVTLPGILPTVIILLILRMGQIFNVDFEKIILMYNPLTYETADVISSYVYRKGLLDFSWSYSTAVNLFNSAMNCIVLVSSNFLFRRFGDVSLW